MGCYLRPTELSEALEALAAAGDGALEILAGGTDFYPARVGRAPDERVLDITALAGLRGIREADDHYLIGALATWSELMRAPLPPCFDGLKEAAREVGGVQIQNTGTICGNICNASPAADGVPGLLTLEAGVEICEYTKGLLHAKTITVDRDACFVSTANFDRRSFELNFEVSLAVYDSDFASQLRFVQRAYMEDSERIDPLRWSRRSWPRRIAHNAAGIFAPIL